MVTNRKLQKEYFAKLRKRVIEQSNRIKQQSSKIPIKVLRSLNKIKKHSDKKVTINGITYSVAEVIKEYGTCYKRLQTKSKPRSYDNILKSYIKDTNRMQEDAEFRKIYNNYVDILEVDFKHSFYDIRFCLQVLKELNKILKESK